MAQAEAKHDQLRQEMRRIRRAIRNNQDVEGLEQALNEIKAQAKALAIALEQCRQMADYLMAAEPYGGPQ
jgi:hypothetical protein